MILENLFTSISKGKYCRREAANNPASVGVVLSGGGGDESVAMRMDNIIQIIYCLQNNFEILLKR